MQINPAALRAIRERSGLSVTALATEAKTKQAHLSNVEAGRRNASEELIINLAAALKVPVTAIICDPAPAVA